MNQGKDQYPTVTFLGYLCYVVSEQYVNGRPAIQLYDAKGGKPFATASVNIPHAFISDRQVFIKDADENEGMLKCRVEAGIVRDTQETIQSGFSTFNLCEILI